MLPNLFGGQYRGQAVVAYSIRGRQGGEKKLRLTRDQIEKLIEQNFLPSIPEQLNNLVRWLAINGVGPGEKIRVATRTHQAIIGGLTPSAVEFALLSLISQRLLSGDLIRTPHGGASHADVSLTYEGWERYSALVQGTATGTTAFMAMSFSNSELDGVVDNWMRAAVEQTGFKLLILSDRPKAGLIDDRLRVEINAARFVIADLTDANNGAYWEAGYAEGRGKPVLYTCKKEIFDSPQGRTHFDTNHHLTVNWDLMDLSKFVGELKATIRATIPEARQED
ncbi:MAG: hypothetical protein ACOH12_11785 [Parvibaculaceae bacterium]